jgi:thiol-disulfide isomerase/thioredoxin
MITPSILLRTLAVIALTATLALSDDTTDQPKPVKPQPGKTEKKPGGNGNGTVDVKVKSEGPDAPKIIFQPFGPATKPASEALKARITPDAQKLIDEIAAAYGKLKSLELAGTYTGDIEAAGQHTGGKIAFTAAYKAPNQFLHDGKDDILIGSNGEKAFAHAFHDHLFLQTDAPKEKVATKDLPGGFHDVLAEQNPSLRLAVAKDPAQELSENVADISKADDTKIADVSYPTLKLTLRDKSTALLAFDPQTHLLRHVSLDLRAQLESRSIPDIKRAMYTVDYTTIKPDAAVKPEQFAWIPPAGAKDIKDIKDPSAGDSDEPAMALVGKEVPDFTLPGLDGKMVSKADLAGHVYILDFWATWCGPCRQSLPHLDELYQSQKAAGLKVFAVNLQEDKATVEDFVTKTKLAVPILLDKEGKTGESFKATGIPETVLVGKDGKVAKVFIGFDETATPEELKKAVEEAMKK